jgi:hypothetical protein
MTAVDSSSPNAHQGRPVENRADQSVLSLTPEKVLVDDHVGQQAKAFRRDRAAGLQALEVGVAGRRSS